MRWNRLRPWLLCRFDSSSILFFSYTDELSTKNDSIVSGARRAGALLVFQIHLQLLGTEKNRRSTAAADFRQFFRFRRYEEEAFRWNLSGDLRVSWPSCYYYAATNSVISSFPTARYVGFYKIGEPAVLIRDLELVKDILVTKFNVFNKNDFALDPEVTMQTFSRIFSGLNWILSQLDPLIAVNPFLVPGDEWKSKRSHLTPLFVPGRIRTAIPYINNITKTLMEYIEGGPESATMEFDVKDVSTLLNKKSKRNQFNWQDFSYQQSSQLTLSQPWLSGWTANPSPILMQISVEWETKCSSRLS